MSDFPRLHDYEMVGIDTETTGLKWWEDSVFGFSIALPDGRDFYYDVREQPRALEWLTDEAKRVHQWCAHHAKFDIHMLREAGVALDPGRVVCTMTRAALLDEHLLTYDLDSLAKKYLGKGKDTDIYAELAAMFGGMATKNAQMPNLRRAPSSLVGRYAKVDARRALELWQYQEHELDRQELRRVAKLEQDLLVVLVDMEHGGVRVDIDRAEDAARQLDAKARTMQRDLDRLAGFAVNPNPSGSIEKLFAPKQDAKGRWILNDGTIAGKTPAGKASINAETLRSMKHPAAAQILQLRKMLKTRDTFIRGHILGHHHNGVIHANFNQTKTDDDVGTGTGRLSVNDPALQQIHKRDKEIAAVVRALFLPDKGQLWSCRDWAQMDFRVFAHYTNDRRILDVYKRDAMADFHQLTADLTGLPRSPRFAGDPNAKQINLGLVFGMGAGKLAAEMGMPFEVESGVLNGEHREWMKPGPEAQAVFDKYHGAVPSVRELLRNASSVAKARGFVRTIMGRHIRFPRGQFTHKAGGLIFQGSAADALKVKLVEVHSYLKSEGSSRLLLNVHDEFDCSVPVGDTKVRAEVGRIVETFDGVDTPIAFRVPIRSEEAVGPNWWEACK